jgi:ABC-type uncharacterized transport system substrate-binding protein
VAPLEIGEPPRKILRPLDAASRFTPAGFAETNITGASNFLPATSAKMLEPLKSVAPNALRVIVLRDPDNGGKWLEVRKLQAGGPALSLAVRSWTYAMPRRSGPC